MGSYNDTYRGVVLDTADPLGQNRVQVQVPSVNSDASTWAVPEQSGATLPAVGDVVAVRYENGDEDHPIWSADASSATGPDDPPAGAGGYHATYRATVIDDVDPGGYRRVQVQVPDVAASDSMWAMPEHADAALPAVGDDVWIRFENGDVAHPTWSGGSGTGGSGATEGPGAAAQPASLDGSYRGTVLDNNDPGGYRRVLVQVPEVSATESMWAMPDPADASAPEIGAEVNVRFDNGDREHAVWSS
jgi:hypothetical protein